MPGFFKSMEKSMTAAATIPAATSASSTTVFKIVATHTCGLNDYYLEDTIVGNKVLKVADRIYVILYIYPWLHSD